MKEIFDKDIGSRIRLARKKANISADYIAKIVNATGHTWYRWERGQNVTNRALRAINYAFAELGVFFDLEWLKTGNGKEPISIKEETNFNSSHLTEGMRLKKEIDAFKSNHPEAIVMLNVSSSLRPVFFPGDYVGGLVIPEKDIPKYSGTYCIVDLKTARPCIRKFNMIRDRYVFTVINPTCFNVSPHIMEKPPERFATIIYHRRITIPEWSIEEGDEGSFPYDSD